MLCTLHALSYFNSVISSLLMLSTVLFSYEPGAGVTNAKKLLPKTF